jgi:hypothetical protein
MLSLKLQPRCVLVEVCYSQIARPFNIEFLQVLARESELRSMSFAEIQQRATAGYLNGATYFEVNEAAVGGVSADNRFMDTQRLASDECEGTVEQVGVTALPVTLCAV